MFDRLFADALAWIAGPGVDPRRPHDDARLPLPSGLETARKNFRLPPRGHYELPASQAQKRALEKHGGRDYEMIDALGTEQADCLLQHLDLEVRVHSRQTQRAADRTRRGQRFTHALVLLGVVDVFAVTALLPGGPLISQENVVLERHPPALSVAPTAAAPPVVPTPDVPTRVVAAASAAPRSAAFLADVGYSRAAALARYPDLALPGSAFNARFVALYRSCQSRNDPRLQRSNWPEILADECAANRATLVRSL